MELEEVPLEKKRIGADAGAIEPAVEVKTKEEAQPDHYAKLQTPAEDIYAEAFFGDSKAKTGKQTVGHASLYRAGCVFLTLICLVLVLVVIVLSMKLQSGSPDCPEWRGPAGEGRSDSPLTLTCNYAQCQTNFPKIQKLLGCNHCADGWLMFEGSCFYMSTVRMSWTMSRNNCTAAGGTLAVVSSLRVQTFLTGASNKFFWIGLQRVANRWRWADNTVLGDSYWVNDQSKGECGLLRTSGSHQKNLLKEPCNHSSYFICEKPV